LKQIVVSIQRRQDHCFFIYIYNNSQALFCLWDVVSKKRNRF
jgi:hypothetical protein